MICGGYKHKCVFMKSLKIITLNLMGFWIKAATSWLGQVRELPDNVYGIKVTTLGAEMIQRTEASILSMNFVEFICYKWHVWRMA